MELKIESVDQMQALRREETDCTEDRLMERGRIVDDGQGGWERQQGRNLEKEKRSLRERRLKS